MPLPARRLAGWTPARLWLLLLGATLLVLAVLGLFRLDVGGWDSAGAAHWAHWPAGLALVAAALLVANDHVLAVAAVLLGAVVLATGAFDLAAGDLGLVGDPGPADDLLHLAVGLATAAAGWASRPSGTVPGRRWGSGEA